MGAVTSRRSSSIALEGKKTRKARRSDSGPTSSGATAIAEEEQQQQQPQEQQKPLQEQEQDPLPTEDEISPQVNFRHQHGDSNGSAVPRRTSRTSRGSRDSRLSKHTSFYEMVDASELNTYLLVGNQACVENIEFLTRKRILFVLNLSNLAVPYVKEGVEYKSILLEDDEEQDLLVHLDECLAFLTKAKKKCEATKSRVLIYSYFGLSRSCSMALAHLMKEERWNLAKSWQHLKQCHSSAKPNDGFLLQLLQYEAKLFGRMSMTIQDFYAR